MQFQEAVDQRQAEAGAGALAGAGSWAEKRSNTLAFTSGARPGPLSATEICTSSPTMRAGQA